MRIAINFHELRSAAIFVFTRMTVTFSSRWLVFVGEVSTTNEEDRWWFVFAFIWLCCRQGDFRFMRKVKGFYCPMAAKGLSHFFQKDKVKNSQLFIFYSRQTTLEFAFVSGCVWALSNVNRCVLFLEMCKKYYSSHVFVFCSRRSARRGNWRPGLCVMNCTNNQRFTSFWKTQATLSCCLFYFNIRAIRTGRSPIL